MEVGPDGGQGFRVRRREMELSDQVGMENRVRYQRPLCVYCYVMERRVWGVVAIHPGGQGGRV